MSIAMIGKESDKRMAERLRESFIEKYSDTRIFKELLEDLGEDCVDRLIHRLKIEEKINLFKDYIELKKIATTVFESAQNEVYKVACEENSARAWINDNGKHSVIAFDALYKVFRSTESLDEYIIVK